MIIYSKENNIDINAIEREITHIKSILENERNLKKLLNKYMDRISDAVNKINNPTDINVIHKCLESLKKNLDNVNNLISSFSDLLNTLNTIKENIDNEKVIEYNNSYKDIFNRYLQVNNEVYSFTYGLMQYTFITFPEETIKEELIYELSKDNKKETVVVSPDLMENTLIISEKNQNVILPYTIVDLKDKLKDNPEEYKTIQDIIDKCYTRSLSAYKNPSLSRFKESLSLIRERENGSLKKALDLGLELFFNSNLHPAIITACKNLDELDIYLDYLENGETDKFTCFNVIFDVAPIMVKNKRGSGF